MVMGASRAAPFPEPDFPAAGPSRITNLSPQVRRLADLTGLREALPLAVPREGRVLPERTGQLTAPQRPA